MFVYFMENRVGLKKRIFKRKAEVKNVEHILLRLFYEMPVDYSRYIKSLNENNWSSKTILFPDCSIVILFLNNANLRN